MTVIGAVYRDTQCSAQDLDRGRQVASHRQIEFTI